MYITRIIKNLAPVALLGVAMAMPQLASANTGGNATVLNVAKVSYTDVSGATNYAETATSTVTVNTVVTNPTVTAPVNQAVASNGTATYSYTVTSTANGSSVYLISSTNGAIVNLASNSTTPSAASIVLGASVIVAVPATGQISIPAGTETNIAVNDILVIGGTDYKVSAIAAGTVASHANASTTDGLAGSTTAEVTTLITLVANPAGTNTAPNFLAGLIGTQVGEQGTFTVAVTGVLGGATGDGSEDTTTSIGGSSDVVTTTIQGVNLSITKEVSVDGGVTFAGTAAGTPTSTLTYRITVVNTGAGSAANVVITDAMPAYTTYTAATAKLDTTAGAVTYAAAATALTDANDAPATDAYDFSITTATTSTLTVGTLAAGGRAVLFYQVTID